MKKQPRFWIQASFFLCVSFASFQFVLSNFSPLLCKTIGCPPCVFQYFSPFQLRLIALDSPKLKMGSVHVDYQPFRAWHALKQIQRALSLRDYSALTFPFQSMNIQNALVFFDNGPLSSALPFSLQVKYLTGTQVHIHFQIPGESLIFQGNLDFKNLSLTGILTTNEYSMTTKLQCINTVTEFRISGELKEPNLGITIHPDIGWNLERNEFQNSFIQIQQNPNFFRPFLNRSLSMTLEGLPEDLRATLSGNLSHLKILIPLLAKDSALKLKQCTLTGGMDLVFQYDDDVQDSLKATLALKEITVTSNAMWKVSKLDGNVRFGLGFPLKTLGTQHLHIESFVWDTLNLSEGILDFQFENSHKLFVEKTLWTWCGGQIYSHAFRLDFEQQKIAFDFFCDHVKIQDLLGLFKNIHATGEGELFGRLPIAYENGKLKVKKGFFYSSPQGGRIQGKDTDLTLLAPKNHPSQKALKIATEALEDFSYQLLSLELSGSNENLQIGFELKGKSLSKDLPPVELKVTIPEGPLMQILNLFSQHKDQIR